MLGSNANQRIKLNIKENKVRGREREREQIEIKRHKKLCEYFMLCMRNSTSDFIYAKMKLASFP